MTPREAMAAMPRKEPHYAVHCEMQDAAKTAGIGQALNAPAAASVELAMLITQFETSIDDEQRARIIALGGLCIHSQPARRLHRGGNCAARRGRWRHRPRG